MKKTWIALSLVALSALSIGGIFTMSEAEAAHKELLGYTKTSSGLEYKDEVVGKGEAATAGKNVIVHYTGTFYPEGSKFDSSKDRGEPFKFKLGAGQVIKGWDQGFAGMHVGGKRVLVIPPALAYGANGIPGAIPPNSTLKFEVELLDVK